MGSDISGLELYKNRVAEHEPCGKPINSNPLSLHGQVPALSTCWRLE